jgi:CRISPR/Cas system-associated exonuclease Cas4 (RecB family)
MTDSALPTRWSYSSISTYENCPAQWHYSYVLKLPEQPSAAMARGTRLHGDCEQFLKGGLTVLPWELKKVSLRLNDLKMMGAKSEVTWLLNKGWGPVTEGEIPWIKAIIDVHWLQGKVLHVRDFKSGREYVDHRAQLELYSIMGLCLFPEATRAEYAAIYLDTAHTSNEGSIIRGAMLERKMKDWNDRALKLFEDQGYLPKPGKHCDWCAFSHHKGGPCLAG